MKKYLTHMLLVWLLLALPISMQAQVNGDFETQRATRPQGLDNVAGSYQAYDDLPGWQAVTNPSGPNAGTANYMATNATSPLVNPQGTPFGYGTTFSPHSGIGCVTIQREPYAYTRDQFITQQVSLLVNHTYQASFYVLRNPLSVSYEQVLFAVNTSAPTGFVAGNYNSQYQTLTPTPYANFTSRPITSSLTWELVTGTFIAQASSSYITIGYGPVFGQASPSGTGILTYAIDDVSLVDMGCAPVADPQALTPNWQCVDGPGPIWGYIDNYDPSLTYTITTTNNIRNSPPNFIVQHIDTTGTTRWGYRLRSVYPGRTGRVTITATNSCGNSGFTTYNITSPGAECDTPPSYSAVGYPNPATDELRAPAGAERAVLLDNQGKPVQRADVSGKLDVQGLPAGLYNLQMMQGGKLINQRIQVKH